MHEHKVGQDSPNDQICLLHPVLGQSNVLATFYGSSAPNLLITYRTYCSNRRVILPAYCGVQRHETSTTHSRVDKSDTEVDLTS